MKWLKPKWPVPKGVRALSTYRAGGASAAPFASLNLGGHVGDCATAVADNRRILKAAAGLPTEPVWLDQVHGTGVRDLDASEPWTPADAAITRLPGRVCAILTADCLPVLFAANGGDCVGAAHAGWRGLSAGVLEATVQAMSAPAEGLTAWLGPAIGPQRFEVGAEVREALLQADPFAGTAFKVNARGRFMADLYALARSRLQQLGVAAIYGGEGCTHSDAELYFSHRRDGQTGRQATLIWLETGPDC